ncbi:MAG: hypothetical protein N3A54_05655 [Patescibacteria group bacterium]|nr:hypothetical protein [Patescibacteria group bacterium]
MQNLTKTVNFLKNHTKEILYIIGFCLSYFFLLLFITKDRTFRLDSDYDIVYSTYTPIIESLRKDLSIPRIHDYARTGMSLPGDPGIFFYNPLFLFPIALFGITNGLYILIALMMSIAGICMWILLFSLSINRHIRIFGSILFVVSGAFAARVGAGHMMFVLSYPVWPLAIWAILKHRIQILGILAAYFFLSGDIYSVWFLTIFYGISIIYFLMKQLRSIRFVIKNLIMFLLFFFVFSSIKLYFFFVDVFPIFERTYQSNPHEGSIHLWWTLLPFIIPWKVMFYDRPFFQRHFGFFFNWYEYYAFIFPLVFVFFLPKIQKWLSALKKNSYTITLVKNDYKNYSKIILSILFFCGILYVCLKYPYSPFYWLFEMVPSLSLFRVPQRMYMPLSGIIIALICLAANTWRHKIHIYTIFGLSIFFTMISSLHAMQHAFERPRTEEQRLVSWLRNYDNGVYFVYADLCCIQRFLVEQKISILNFYTGWKPKNSPSFSQENKPKYIIARPTEDFSNFSYKKIHESSIGTIWKTDEPTIVPDHKRKPLEKSKKDRAQKYLL